jgi:hypothetical protein
MAKSNNNLKLVVSNILSAVEEIELEAYVNFEEGLASSFGRIAERARDGTLGPGGGADPEDVFIRAIDLKTTNRRIHQVMLAIEPRHARTLTRAFLVERYPPYVKSQFGRLAGVVLGNVDDEERLALWCRKVALRHEGKEEARAELGKLRIEALNDYNAAARAYSRVLRALPRQLKGPFGEAVQRRTAAPHECRVSTVYPCPCRGDL